MPQPVDVGSVLGGRYKVTGRVLASADQDLVLDGIDQVLNRPVSILLASPSNASQVTASARELATGERAGTMQVLDLGISDDHTYLVTDRAAAADLLDLVIEQNQPYIEPFFTDTLGSDIFGQARSTEPMNYEDDRRDEQGKRQRKARSSDRSRMQQDNEDDGTGWSGAAFGTNAPPLPSSPPKFPASGSTSTSPRNSSPEGSSPENLPPEGSSPQDEPRVSIWTTEDYKSAKRSPRQVQRESPPRRPESRFPSGATAGAGPAGAGVAGSSAAGAAGTDTRVAHAAAGGTGTDGPPGVDPDQHSNGAPRSDRTVRRTLVGALFAALLIVAVVLSVSTLGTLFENQPVAGPEPTTSTPPEPSSTPSATPIPEQTAPVTPEAVSVLRLVPNNPELNSGSDSDLGNVIDDNPASYWQSFVFASNTFGGLAQNMALVVELREASPISQVEITQLNGSGGNFTILLNDTPTLDGAQQIAQSSFTGTSVTVPVPEEDGSAAEAQYVIVNFTQLPRLSGIEAQYPWGLRIAEISVS